jgi:hypothetical protein
MSVGGDLAKWKRRNDVHSFLDDINFGVGSDCCCGGFINCFYFDVQRCCKDIPTAAPRPGPRPTWYHPIEEDSIG